MIASHSARQSSCSKRASTMSRSSELQGSSADGSTAASNGSSSSGTSQPETENATQRRIQPTIVATTTRPAGVRRVRGVFTPRKPRPFRVRGGTGTQRRLLSAARNDHVRRCAVDDSDISFAVNGVLLDHDHDRCRPRRSRVSERVVVLRRELRSNTRDGRFVARVAPAVVWVTAGDGTIDVHAQSVYAWDSRDKEKVYTLLFFGRESIGAKWSLARDVTSSGASVVDCLGDPPGGDSERAGQAADDGQNEVFHTSKAPTAGAVRGGGLRGRGY